MKRYKDLKPNPTELKEERLSKFLQDFRIQYRKGTLLTFKGWIKIMVELLDDLE